MSALRAAGLGPWPGTDAREAAAASFAELGEGLPPLPLLAAPAVGETRWAVDAVGCAAALLDGLPVDRDSYGWRLAAGAGRDLRRERSRTARALEAAEEYGAGFEGRALLSLPGPWTLLSALSLPGGGRALADPGAVRDVLQAYAAGAEQLLARAQRALGQAPRVRLLETALDAVLAGRVPTVSGLRTLPAVPEAAVVGGLRSFLRRTGEDTIIALPRLGSVEVRGARLRREDLLADAGAGAIAVPLPADSPAGRAHWERLAEAADSGTEVWLRLPADAGAEPGEVTRWVDAVRRPWTALGMPAAAAAALGVLTGWELPVDDPPLLPADAAPAGARTRLRLAARIAAALEEDA
ncbi:hypothetical protein GSY69_07935 [Brevibacterium sp. 5221]|uniref:Methionine synthase n=1 Tax=Brevibacterium rongguiense TaxID=2695267 RepID=A0A6N9H7X0_9MICO|nr:MULTISPECIES: hypothetical protein [Brevibacterium]MYM19896.1 hypothetical protein [Brevibacterium rongguiense]WAL41423.1 hypothetical protein BRM1_06155 [Brevibacterium sp. BRM-1]